MRNIYEEHEGFAQYLCERIGKVVDSYDLEMCTSDYAFVVAFAPKINVSFFDGENKINMPSIDKVEYPAEEKQLLLFNIENFIDERERGSNKDFFMYQDRRLKDCIKKTVNILKHSYAIKSLKPEFIDSEWLLFIEYFSE